MRSARWEQGTGLISSLAAILVFLAFVMLAAQLAVGLLATSVVEAAALDSARAVASRRVDHRDPTAVQRAERAAESRFRRLAGRAARRASFRWTVSEHLVRLHVRMPIPRLAGAAQVLGSDVERTVAVRVEEPAP